MRFLGSLCGLGACLIFALGLAVAGEPAYRHAGHPPGTIIVPPGCPQYPAPVPGVPGRPAEPGRPSEPGRPPEPGAEPTTPQSDAFARAEEAGPESRESFNPNLIGDQLLTMPFSSTPTATPTARPSDNLKIAQQTVAALAGRGAFKITDNESPRPQTRIFLNYNFFNNVGDDFRTPGTSQLDVSRETGGFEYAFLDGDASLGLRVPFVQMSGDGSLNGSSFGDLTAIMKWAMVNNRDTGNVLATGLALTIPTGPNAIPVPGQDSIHSFLFQPYLGLVYNMDRLFVQGFTSLVIPTDSRDITILFNDFGVGYFVYRNDGSGGLTQVVPTFEVHINTPLSNRGSLNTPIGLADSVILTQGVHFTFFDRATMLLGVAEPITGPRPFAIEGIAQVNIRF